MSPLARLIFHPNDDALLKHEYDDNQKIEPVWYIPILPMVLVNGADGIGTGWMTRIPNYNIRDIVRNIRALLDGSDLQPMIPFYKGFKGTIEDGGDHRYVVSGEVSIIGSNQLEITELPVGTWTHDYEENVLKPLVHGSVISNYKQYNTDTTVKFILTVLPGQMENMQKDGIHKVLKLQTVLETGSMCAFDEHGCLRRFDSALEILQEFYTFRLTMYQRRKEYLEEMLEAESEKLNNQVRFVNEQCNRTFVIEDKKFKIVEELVKRGYAPDPVKEWKKRNQIEEAPEEENEAEKAFKNSSDLAKFKYLLGMPILMLTKEKKNELLKQRDTKLAELEVMRKKSTEELWRNDLDIFMEKYEEVEEKERLDRQANLEETEGGQRVAPNISVE